MNFDDPRFLDYLIASASRFLIDGQEEDAASVLLSCRCEIVNIGFDEDDEYHGGYYQYSICMFCPRVAFDIMMDKSNPVGVAITRSIFAVVPIWPEMKELLIRGEMIDLDPGWKSELLQIAQGKGVHNQLADVMQARVRTWNNLRFRSQSEVRIAVALDRAGVFFLPNCRGRLTTPSGRENREADFLICCEGKWGILEVDGEPYHPPSRTVHDHERDRLFRTHGIKVVEHFDASECFENAGSIVTKFLELLRTS